METTTDQAMKSYRFGRLIGATERLAAAFEALGRSAGSLTPVEHPVIVAKRARLAASKVENREARRRNRL